MTTPTARVAPLPIDPVAGKAALRRVMRARRAACDPALGERLCAHLRAAPTVLGAAVLAGYWPLPGEVDLRPVLEAACARGQVIGLPVTPEPGGLLTFRRWEPGAPLRPGRFGTQEPEGPPVRPDVLLVPLLAFDRAGGRLGYGGGFYDRALAALHPAPLAIGCGYAAQEVDRLPLETHDWRMGAIATEAGLFFVEPSVVRPKRARGGPQATGDPQRHP